MNNNLSSLEVQAGRVLWVPRGRGEGEIDAGWIHGIALVFVCALAAL